MARPNPKNRLEQSRRDAQKAVDGRTYGREKDVRDPYIFWDTYTLAASAATTVLFNNGSSAKPYSISNYPYAQVPTKQAIDIYGIRVSYTGHALFADATTQLWYTWLSKSVFQLKIVNKTQSYERTLAGMIGGAVHVHTAPAVTVESQSLSKWTADTVIHFKRKVYLDQNVPCYVNIFQDVAPDAALSGDFLRTEWITRWTTFL